MSNEDKDLTMNWNKPSKAGESDIPQIEIEMYVRMYVCMCLLKLPVFSLVPTIKSLRDPSWPHLPPFRIM